MKTAGIYIHVPFCNGKCPYCDFYSHISDEAEFDIYTSALCDKILTSSYDFTADTLYFGGGTPGLIGADRIGKITGAVSERFGFSDNVEITVEINPTNDMLDFDTLAKAGVNRISMGLQSADDYELLFLGRKHDSKKASECMYRARKSGFDNISLDLMLALPGQTKEKLRKSAEFCVRHDAKHISAYILKIEEGTVFYHNRNKMVLPDDDETAELYEYFCTLMKEYGYEHYEISNFCKTGYESRHNLKYWHDEEYIGFGPSAHSFYNRTRFYVPRNMQQFYDGITVSDGTGGDEEEFVMLGLRLSEGITNAGYKSRFGKDIPSAYKNNAHMLEKAGLVRITGEGFGLTEKGFMVSNAVISKILEG